MNHDRPYRAITLATGILLFGTSANAFEIELQAEAVCRSAVIRLGDVAEIRGVDPMLLEPMKRIALAPAPTTSHTRSVSASHIRAVLTRRKVDLAGCHFTGPPRVMVQSAAQIEPTSSRDHQTTRPAQFSLTAIKQQLSRAVLEQLESQASADQWSANQWSADQWDVQVDLSRRKLWDLPRDYEQIRLVGMTAPFDGQHSVTAEFCSEQETAAIPVEVKVQRRQMAVVAARHLERGAFLQEADVQLSAIPAGHATTNAISDLDQVVGKELTRRVAAGQMLVASAMRRPLLVRRSEVVDVIARAGLITVRRTAQAREEGALGDTILLETLDGERTRFRATVKGTRQAEVTVSTPQTTLAELPR